MGEKLTTAYFSLGSNLGNRQEHLEKAIQLLKETIGSEAILSSLYESPAWGYESQNPFLNTCIGILTGCSPEEILKKIQQIEQECGRVRTKSKETIYLDRSVDIDLILFGNQQLKSDSLIVPHPLFRQRLFVLVPLSEIAPEAIDPVTHLTVNQLLKNCTSSEKMQLFITE